MFSNKRIKMSLKLTPIVDQLLSFFTVRKELYRQLHNYTLINSKKN